LDLGKRDGKRRRRYFSARKAAEAALREADAVGRRWAFLEPERRADVVAILDEIEAAGLTLKAVWDDFRSGFNATACVSKSLGDAITELVKAKTGANRRPSYVASLEQYLRRWAKGKEAMSIASVKLDDIEVFLNALPSHSSRATGINRLSTLFSFAVRRGWRSDNPCERIERPHIDYGIPAILTVGEAAKVLTHARRRMPRFLPWLVLAMFGGLRPEEIDRLSWDAVDLERGIVTIGAQAAKVRARRIVHLKPVAVEWLRLGGDMPLPHVTRRRCLRKWREILGWRAWRKDVLRHSAASYWLAVEPDAPRIAMELGNSPAVLFKHYREVVTDEEAKKYWALFPNNCDEGS
jgi:integrase/recombinase XerD